MPAKFTLQEIERTVTFHGDEGDHSDEYDEGPVVEATFREALDALNSGCWDSLDERGDGTVIAYPADSSMNIRTGAYESTHLIVKAARPEWAIRLVDCHRS